MIYVLSGGGGSGCTLVVTGVAGDTCTITNSSTGKSKTKTFDANKQATFKGLATGTWTVKMTGSSGTATRTVTINADYTCTITYFSATINITYPEASVCTITNSSGETVASDLNGSASSTKTFTATVGAADTYTITSTSSDGASTATQDVVITTDGQSETVEMSYWNGELYDAGNQYESVTGGWAANAYVIFNDTSVTLGYSSDSKSGDGYITTTNKIDLTNFTTLQASLAVYKTKSFAGYLQILSTNTASATAVEEVAFTKGAIAPTLDISSLTGEYYVRVKVESTFHYTMDGAWYEYSDFNVTKVVLT